MVPIQSLGDMVSLIYIFYGLGEQMFIFYDSTAELLPDSVSIFLV